MDFLASLYKNKAINLAKRIELLEKYIAEAERTVSGPDLPSIKLPRTENPSFEETIEDLLADLEAKAEEDVSRPKRKFPTARELADPARQEEIRKKAAPVKPNPPAKPKTPPVAIPNAPQQPQSSIGKAVEAIESGAEKVGKALESENITKIIKRMLRAPGEKLARVIAGVPQQKTTTAPKPQETPKTTPKPQETAKTTPKPQETPKPKTPTPAPTATPVTPKKSFPVRIAKGTGAFVVGGAGQIAGEATIKQGLESIPGANIGSLDADVAATGAAIPAFALTRLGSTPHGAAMLVGYGLGKGIEFGLDKAGVWNSLATGMAKAAIPLSSVSKGIVSKEEASEKGKQIKVAAQQARETDLEKGFASPEEAAEFAKRMQDPEYRKQYETRMKQSYRRSLSKELEGDEDKTAAAAAWAGESLPDWAATAGEYIGAGIEKVSKPIADIYSKLSGTGK